MKKKCIEKNNNKIIPFKEQRSSLFILNKEQQKTSKIKVDGCEITEGLRCDYLLLTDKMEYFIELKGQDINHAIKQLRQSISKLSRNAREEAKVSFVICSRSPLSSASIQNEQLKFKKEFNSRLIIKSSPFNYEI